MLTLHPFQEAAVDQLRAGLRAGHKRQMLAIATGGGKTVVASHIIRAAASKGTKSLFVVDRVVLVEQAARHLRDMGLKVGVMQAENTQLGPDDEVIVASIQTLARRAFPLNIGLVVIDEAHILHKTHIDIIRTRNLLPVIGLSATPLREDLGRHFSNLVRGPSVAELMDDGFLVRPTVYCPSQDLMDAALQGVKTRAGDFAETDLSRQLNSKELVGDVIATWQAKAAGLRTLVFAVDVAHSKAIFDDFIAAGVRAGQLDYTTKPEEREAIIGQFREGSVTVLCSVNVLGVGFDVPDVRCAVLARPTLSEALYIQQIGRALRTAEGKDSALILDHAGNTLRFGLPEQFEVPDLGSGNHRSGDRKRRDTRVATCPTCGAVMEAGLQTCPVCGVDRPTRTADVHYLDADLTEFGAGASGRRTYTVDQCRAWYRMAMWYAQRSGRKPGWPYFAYLRMFNGDKPPYRWRDLPPLEPTDEVARWLRGHDRYSRIRFSKRRTA